jgi:hypothetical protein
VQQRPYKYWGYNRIAPDAVDQKARMNNPMALYFNTSMYDIFHHPIERPEVELL